MSGNGDGWWMDHMGEWHQGQPPGTPTTNDRWPGRWDEAPIFFDFIADGIKDACSGTHYIEWETAREWANSVVDALRVGGFEVVDRGCRHEFDPSCARCQTLAHFKPWMTAQNASRGEAR